MLIDKQGKLFGIINAVDLLVVTIIMLLVFFGTYKFTDNNDEATKKDILVKAIVSEVRDPTVNAVNEGDIVRDSTTGKIFGKVVDVEVVPFEKPVEDNGEMVKATVPGYYDICLLIKSRGLDSDKKTKIASKTVRIGKEIKLQTKDFSVTATIWNISM